MVNTEIKPLEHLKSVLFDECILNVEKNMF